MTVSYPILPRNKDRRVKLSDENRARIQQLHSQGIAIREIARLYPQVSRRLIQFVIFPERQEKLANRVKAEKKWTYYYKRYGKDYHNKQMKKHRRYKNLIQKEGISAWRKEQRKKCSLKES